MLKKIKTTKSPKVLVITPLRPKDTISNVLSNTIKNNYIEFDWYSYSSDNNTAKNFQLALDQFNKLPPAVIKIDNDIEMGNRMLDMLYDTLIKSNNSVAYSYCSFSYVGAINAFFPPMEWNFERLKMGNYISSNSMIKSSIIRYYPLITDDKYKRLLDWAYFLHLGNKGYIGKVDTRVAFKAHTKHSSVSTNDAEDYRIKHNRVISDFL